MSAFAFSSMIEKGRQNLVTLPEAQVEAEKEASVLDDGKVVEALEAIPNTNIVEGETIKLQGDNAKQYVKWRDVNRLQSALDRQARQIQFMKALAIKTLTISKGNSSRMLEIYSIITQYATINLEASEVTFLATILANGSGGFDMVSLKGKSVMNDDSQWEQFILDRDSVYQTIFDMYYTKAE